MAAASAVPVVVAVSRHRVLHQHVSGAVFDTTAHGGACAGAEGDRRAFKAVIDRVLPLRPSVAGVGRVCIRAYLPCGGSRAAVRPSFKPV